MDQSTRYKLSSVMSVIANGCANPFLPNKAVFWHGSNELPVGLRVASDTKDGVVWVIGSAEAFMSQPLGTIEGKAKALAQLEPGRTRVFSLLHAPGSFQEHSEKDAIVLPAVQLELFP